MVLNHVAHGPGFIVIPSPVSHAQLFRNGQLYMINIIPVPERLENRIGKTKSQNILNSLFSKVMINAINLILGKDVVKKFIEGLGRLQVASKWVLNDDSCLLRIRSKLMLGKILSDCGEEARGYREIVDNARFFFPFLRQRLDSFGHFQIGLFFSDVRTLII